MKTAIVGSSYNHLLQKNASLPPSELTYNGSRWSGSSGLLSILLLLFPLRHDSTSTSLTPIRFTISPTIIVTYTFPFVFRQIKVCFEFFKQFLTQYDRSIDIEEKCIDLIRILVNNV